jgi:molybdopterin-guanine dinucleotide biosynthesis protein A
MLGVVLAGGESRRMGRDKADVCVAGEPLWLRQSRTLAAAGASPVVLIRRRDQLAPNGIECWRDRRPSCGPLTGLEAALAPQSDPYVAVLAIDLPEIALGWFAWLRSHCLPQCGAAVRQGDFCEPLAAIYPAAAIQEIRTRLDQGKFSARELVRALAATGRMTLVDPPAAATLPLRNLNTPAELAAWEKNAPNSGLSAARP